jgi:hypothetical protein
MGTVLFLNICGTSKYGNLLIRQNEGRKKILKSLEEVYSISLGSIYI